MLRRTSDSQRSSIPISSEKKVLKKEKNNFTYIHHFKLISMERFLYSTLKICHFKSYKMFHFKNVVVGIY